MDETGSDARLNQKSIFMKVTIKLTQAEVSGIALYLAEIEGVAVTAIDDESIANEVHFRLHQALRDPREAISDHIKDQEREKSFRLNVVERDGSGDSTFEPCGIDRLFKKINGGDFEVLYSLHETTGARQKIEHLKIGETFTFEASRDDKRAVAILTRVG